MANLTSPFATLPRGDCRLNQRVNVPDVLISNSGSVGASSLDVTHQNSSGGTLD